MAQLAKLILVSMLSLWGIVPLLPAHSQNVQSNSLAKSIIEDATAKKAISFRFDSLVADIAVHYTNKTEFAGKVRVNQPYQPEALNIYVVDASKRSKFSSLFRNSCQSWAAYTLIVCDAKFLDAMPASFAVFFEGVTNSGSPLMYWAIGHEIGHVMLNHDESRFGSAFWPEGAVAFGAQGELEKFNFIKREIEADEFAVNGFPVRSKEDVAFFEITINDAFFFEVMRWSVGLSHLAKIELPFPGPTDTHPPLLWRLDNLISIFNYNYIFAHDSRNAEVVFSESPSRNVEDDTIFFEGYYVDGVYAHPYQEERFLDYITASLVQNTVPYEALYLAADCGSERQYAERSILNLQHAALCNNARIDANDDILHCSSLEAEDFPRCRAVKSLLVWICVNASSGNLHAASGCEDIDELISSSREHQKQDSILQSKDYSILTWQIDVEYSLFDIIHNYSFNDVVVWSFNNCSQFFGVGLNEEYKFICGYIFPKIEQDYLVSDFKKSISIAESSFFYRVCADVFEQLMADYTYIDCLESYVDLMKKNTYSERFHAAESLIRLSRAYRYFLVTEITASNRSTLNSYRQADIERSDEWSLVYKKSLISARRAVEHINAAVSMSPDLSSDEACVLSALQINAYSEFLFSSNVTANSDLGLEYVNILMGLVTKYHREFGVNSEYEDTIVGPAIENIAATLVAAEKGDPVLAVEISQQALRRAEDRAGRIASIQMLAGLAYYKVGEIDLARKHLSEAEVSYGQESGRPFPPNYGWMVSGEFITFEEIIGSEGR